MGTLNEQVGSADKRRSRRVAYPCEARCFGVGESIYDTRLTDLSVTGAFVRTRAELPAGTIVLLRFEAEGRRVKTEAEVVHAEPGQGMGVRFVNLRPEIRGVLARIAGEPPA
jgi:hypothetical protein